MRLPRVVNPDKITELEVKRADLEAAHAIKAAADKIMEAGNLIINCMTELRPEIKSLANRNYREIQMSSNAIRQHVSILENKAHILFNTLDRLFLDRRSIQTRSTSSSPKTCFSRR